MSLVLPALRFFASACAVLNYVPMATPVDTVRHYHLNSLFQIQVTQRSHAGLTRASQFLLASPDQKTMSSPPDFLVLKKTLS